MRNSEKINMRGKVAFLSLQKYLVGGLTVSGVEDWKV